MIDDLDRSLQKLLELEFGTPLPFDLSFAIPDKDFKPVSTQRSTLNCYLFDIREDRDLREVGRSVQREPGGVYTRDNPPCRVKSTFCITAWSPAEASPSIDPHLDEHQLLAAVLRALLRYPEFPTAALVGVLVAQPLPMPTAVAQPVSDRQASEFWNAIGGRLRPSLQYVVTMCLDYQPIEKGPLVSSVLTQVGERREGGEHLVGTPDSRYAIGGTVWSSGLPASRVPGAWVRVDQTGELAVSDSTGQFAVTRVQAGEYTLTVRATGFKEGRRPLAVPLGAGSYDVIVDPL